MNQRRLSEVKLALDGMIDPGKTKMRNAAFRPHEAKVDDDLGFRNGASESVSVNESESVGEATRLVANDEGVDHSNSRSPCDLRPCHAIHESGSRLR